MTDTKTEVKRFSRESRQMIEYSGGDWVRYRDFYDLQKEFDLQMERCIDLGDELQRLRAQLNEEQNDHAELQDRCFGNGWPTGWSVFDELAKAEKERDLAHDSAIEECISVIERQFSMGHVPLNVFEFLARVLTAIKRGGK